MVSKATLMERFDDFRVLLAGSRAVDPAAVTASLIQALERMGVVGVPVRTDLVDGIPRTALGKAPLIRRAAPIPAAH